MHAFNIERTKDSMNEWN